MKILKAGTILINLNNQKIALVVREKLHDYTFPKGHLEEFETLEECAIRETEEETGRKNHLLKDIKLPNLYYETPKGESIELHFYLAIDDGQTDKYIKEEDREKSICVSFDEVESKLTYDDLLEYWLKIKDAVKKVMNNY